MTLDDESDEFFGGDNTFSYHSCFTERNTTFWHFGTRSFLNIFVVIL